MRFDRYWANSEISLVDPHWTKIGQNAPSCSGGKNKPAKPYFPYKNVGELLYPSNDQTTYTSRAQTVILAQKYPQIFSIPFSLLHLLPSKKQQKYVFCCAVLKPVNIFEPKLQIMFFLYILINP